MNQEYIYINGNVVVKDENGKGKPINYQKKLDKILTKENTIELMKQELAGLELRKIKLELMQKEENQSTLKFEFRILPLLILSMSLIIPYVTSLQGDNPIFQTIFGTMHASTLLTIIMTSTVGLPLSIGFFLKGYQEYKKGQNDRKITETQIQCLEKQLEKEEKELIELQKVETKEQDLPKRFYESKINLTISENFVQNLLNTCRDCVLYQNKYTQYLQKGILEEKLKDSYKEPEIQLIKTYLEENQKVKRK